MIAKITKAYVRHYSDSGHTCAYVEWIDSRGRTGRTEGETSLGATHMMALLARARREGVTIERQDW